MLGVKISTFLAASNYLFIHFTDKVSLPFIQERWQTDENKGTWWTRASTSCWELASVIVVFLRVWLWKNCDHCCHRPGIRPATASLISCFPPTQNITAHIPTYWVRPSQIPIKLCLRKEYIMILSNSIHFRHESYPESSRTFAFSKCLLAIN